MQMLLLCVCAHVYNTYISYINIYIVGIYFPHIRLLATAFTHPSVGNLSISNPPFDPLQTGNNQRLEFLGDSVLQFLVSRYIYNRFPEFLEGQLSVPQNNNNNTNNIITNIYNNNHSSLRPHIYK